MKKYAEIIDTINVFSIIVEAKHVYGPYTRKSDGRKHVIVVDDNGSRRTVSWPKHLMEEHLGRILDPDESTIDHWDTDINNNDLENLRIVPRSQHSGDDTRRVKLLDLECAMCKKIFQRSPRIVRDKSSKGKVSQFCSRTCAGRYSRAVQLGLMEKLPVQPPPPSEYYKRKYQELETEANLYYLLAKYG